MKANGKMSIVFFSVAAALLALLIAVSCVVASFDSLLTFYFGSSQLDSATRESGETLATRIEEEGIVMVKNDGNCLPLKEDDVKKEGEHRVNVFGWASIDWLMSGSGSGRAVNGSSSNLKPATDLFKALEGYTVFSDNGIKHNTELETMYKSFKSGRDGATDTLNTYDYNSCVLYEPDFTANYTDTLKQNAATYSDVALVVLGRISGESNDAPLTQYRYSKGTSASNKVTDDTRTYLDVSPDEEELLRYVGSNYDKVIVIINSTNQMNLNFMDEIDGLDACLIVGGTGNNAANAIPNVLFGQKKVAKTDDDGEVIKDADGNIEYEIVKCSPSGKTVDTYAYDFKTNPNWFYAGKKGIGAYTGTNSGLYPIGTENANVGTPKPKYDSVSYLDYVEGIYVGYKWYETADAEGYWDNVSNDYGKKYDGVVQYPFGFGLSYTTFDWDVALWDEKDGKITVTVDVTNTGDYVGQEVVELYFTPYYNEKSGLEKAAVNLCAFAKTEVLFSKKDYPDSPEKYSQRLTLSFDIQDMASYDQNKDDGAYVLERGNYEISLRTDSHNIAKVNSGKATYTYNPGKDEVYNTYAGTNGSEEISNLFVGSNNSDGVAIDGSDSNQTINWLSRKDKFANFPTEKAAARAWQTALNATNKYTKEAADAWDAEWVKEHGAQSFTQGQGNTYNLANSTYNSKLERDVVDSYTDDAYFFGNPENFDSDSWEKLLDQLTTEEMENLVAHGYVQERELKSIGKPKTVSVDGPSQYGSFNANNYTGVGYPNPTVLAQSWNAELSKSFGMAVATQALSVYGNGWYAPGVNLHRSAFGGRNYEYYSEDPYLSGIMCANTVKGALNLGVYTYIKHFIGYDQESMRDSLYCWMTEQALRENYLRPFKMAIDEGATGLMTSYGRLGAVWSGGSEALLTDLLRNEWGFKGAVLTDYSDHQDFMNGDQMLRAGGDLWMDGYSNNGRLGVYGTKGTDAYNYMLRQAAKHVIFMWTNAAYEAKEFTDNGGDTGPQIERAGPSVFKWWWIIVAVVDVGCAAGAGALVFFGVKKLKAAKSNVHIEDATSEE